MFREYTSCDFDYFKFLNISITHVGCKKTNFYRHPFQKTQQTLVDNLLTLSLHINWNRSVKAKSWDF